MQCVVISNRRLLTVLFFRKTSYRGDEAAGARVAWLEIRY